MLSPAFPWQEFQASLAADTIGMRASELGAGVASALQDAADALQQLSVGTLPTLPDRNALDGAVLAAARAYTTFRASGMRSTPTRSPPAGASLRRAAGCLHMLHLPGMLEALLRIGAQHDSVQARG